MLFDFRLCIALLFLLSCVSFAQSNFRADSSNFIMDYALMDILPIYDSVSNEAVNLENGLESHRHSIGIDFGTTIFAAITAPMVLNRFFGQPKYSANQTLEGKFGFRLTYTYRILEKIDLDAALGVYVMNTYYTNSSSYYYGGVYAIPLSIGLRFYFNKKDRASGFFLNPKIGSTFFITKGTEYINGAGSKKDSFMFDFYVSSELGFRIDISRNLGIDRGARVFIDVSLLDLGVSYSYIFRFVPLPRLAIGVLF